MDRGELDAKRKCEFFRNLEVRVALTMAYHLEANGKKEHGHSPIVKTLVKACKGKVID